MVKPPGNLPGQLTSFVGRQGTIAAVGQRLAQDRLVGLVGPGGCGKTRLAIEEGRKPKPARRWRVLRRPLGAVQPGVSRRLGGHSLGLRDTGRASDGGASGVPG